MGDWGGGSIRYLYTVSYRHCNNNTTDVAQEVMLHIMQRNILSWETKLLPVYLLYTAHAYYRFVIATTGNRIAR